MATSVYFNNQGATREQILIEDMIIESIRNHGIDIYYLPRESQSSLVELFGDDPVKYYSKAYKIDMYLETFNDYEGNQEFFSKFGLEIQKSARITVARRTFERFIPDSVRILPKEGDLIWMPVQQKMLEIKFVEEEKNFFQAGKIAPYMYGLNIETFKYNGELFNTGIDELDAVADKNAPSTSFLLNVGGSGTYQHKEIVYQGANLNTANAFGYVAGWDLPTRTIRLRNIRGRFTSNVAIVGNTSGASWIITSYDSQDDTSTNYDDNSIIESDADNILDWSELNPFGSPDE